MQQKDESLIECLCPSLSFWVQLIDFYTEKYLTGDSDIRDVELVLQQLIENSSNLNLSDEVGKISLVSSISILALK